MKKNINTGMIMDAVNLTKDAPEKNEAMQAAIDNDQIKKLEILAQQYKNAHTQKVREYKKVGRNDPATVDVNDLEVIKNGGTPSVQQTQTTQKTVTSTSSVSSGQTNVTQDENTDDLPF